MSPIVEFNTHHELTMVARTDAYINEYHAWDYGVPPIFQWRQDAPNMVTAWLEHVRTHFSKYD
jgi:hypothetical protein